ncbi:PQQ-binding-like beta-propeller repeat protein [Microbacterium sp. 18062]|uniref:outer membrane protein assembly factor BamB family protein n=1 Tax=Microbacterium sp. 18062 TaxID=2681410 RepID=UPI00135995ED|nr:PQQ-binding-like beta-propeller repeat protein [Microbacterium sp. 18062]
MTATTFHSPATGLSSVALLAAVGLALTGCVPGAATDTESSAAPLSAEQRIETLLVETIEPEWSVEADSVGTEAVRVDDVVLFYAADGEAASLHAVDAETGEELWQAPATVGASSPERLWSPVVTHDAEGSALTFTVGSAEQQADGNWAHRLEVRDAHTGEVRPSPAPTWVSTVLQCGSDICLQAWAPSDDPDGVWRTATLDVDAATLVPGEELEGAAISWRMTDNLRLGVTDDYLAWEEDDEEVWRTTLSEHLPAGVPPAAFGDGYTFSMAVDDPYAPTVALLGFETSGDPVYNGVFAFALADGSALWSRDDIALCDNGDPVFCSLEQVHALRDDDADPTPTTYTGLDPATGEETWSVTLDAASPDSEVPHTRLSGYTQVLDGDAPSYIESATGDLLPVPDAAVLACTDAATWTGRKNARESDEMVEYSTGSVASPCDTAGAPVEGPFSRAAVLTAAWTAWGEEGAVPATAVTALGQPADDPLDEREAWYYVPTATGISAYRF